MTKKKILLIIGILLILLTATVSSVGAQETPKARAILFYSPNCGHCHEVITTVLQPMMAQYGDSLLILGIDVTVESGSALWGAAMEEIGYPTDQAGVPFMLVDDQVMVGSAQIPDEFPGMVEEALAGEGIPLSRVHAAARPGAPTPRWRRGRPSSTIRLRRRRCSARPGAA